LWVRHRTLKKRAQDEYKRTHSSQIASMMAGIRPTDNGGMDTVDSSVHEQASNQRYRPLLKWESLAFRWPILEDIPKIRHDCYGWVVYGGHPAFKIMGMTVGSGFHSEFDDRSWCTGFDWYDFEWKEETDSYPEHWKEKRRKIARFGYRDPDGRFVNKPLQLWWNKLPDGLPQSAPKLPRKQDPWDSATLTISPSQNGRCPLHLSPVPHVCVFLNRSQEETKCRYCNLQTEQKLSAVVSEKTGQWNLFRPAWCDYAIDKSINRERDGISWEMVFLNLQGQHRWSGSTFERWPYARPERGAWIEYTNRRNGFAPFKRSLGAEEGPDDTDGSEGGSKADVAAILEATGVNGRSRKLSSRSWWPTHVIAWDPIAANYRPLEHVRGIKLRPRALTWGLYDKQTTISGVRRSRDPTEEPEDRPETWIGMERLDVTKAPVGTMHALVALLGAIWQQFGVLRSAWWGDTPGKPHLTYISEGGGKGLPRIFRKSQNIHLLFMMMSGLSNKEMSARSSFALEKTMSEDAIKQRVKYIRDAVLKHYGPIP
jgi:hypothetical protein